MKYYLLVEWEGRARARTKKTLSCLFVHYISSCFLINTLNTAKARRRITDAPTTPATPVTVDNFDEIGIFARDIFSKISPQP